MSNNSHSEISTPALVTMQWLTYVFWALTSIAVVFLTSVIFQYLLGINADLSTEAVAYAVAAAVIFLPIAFVLDVFFSRHEDKSRSSAGSLIMVIHSVIFAVVSIVALVVTVFNLINMMLNSFDERGMWVAVAAALATFIGFGLLFVRTARHNLLTNLRQIYRYTMLGIVIAAAIIALFGPFARAMETKQSRAVRDTINTAVSVMSDFVATNNKLPNDISTLVGTTAFYNMGGNLNQASDLINKGLITYKANIKEAVSEGGATTYYYQICGTFDKDINTGLRISTPMSYNEYSSYLNLTDVASGTHCYKLSASTAIKIYSSQAVLKNI